MSRIYTFTLLMTGIMLLFYFGGLNEGNDLLDILLNPEELSFNDFWDELLIVLGGVAVGIFVGFRTNNAELAAMAGFTSYYGVLLWNFLDVFNKIYAINTVMAILIFSPLFLVFSITLVDYWRGA